MFSKRYLSLGGAEKKTSAERAGTNVRIIYVTTGEII